MTHDCLECLEFHQEQFSEVMDPEVDGSTDHWWEEWFECGVCHEKFTQLELDAIYAKEAEDGGTETEIRER